MTNFMNDPATAGLANLAYYEANAVAYAEKTSRADLSHLYAPFLASLPRGARILDVGCGGGRDLKAFRELGFKPVGIDPSPALVEIARQYSGAEVAVADVQEMEFVDEFEAVWACASLLHLPKLELSEALRCIKRSLISGGVFFLSLQNGSGEHVIHDGRFYARYGESEIQIAVQQNGFEIFETWETTDSLANRSDIHWINLLAKKSLQINDTNKA